MTLLQARYGERIPDLIHNGRTLQAGVFDEHAIRAASGVALVLASVALAYAYFDANYLPMQLITAGFFIEFVLRVAFGLRYAPVGALGVWMARNSTPRWLSAKSKRFTWTLGLLMSVLLLAIIFTGSRGALPMAVCLVCMVMMWLETALGLCLGCELYRFVLRRGWIGRDAAIEICSQGACDIDAKR